MTGVVNEGFYCSSDPIPPKEYHQHTCILLMQFSECHTYIYILKSTGARTEP